MKRDGRVGGRGSPGGGWMGGVVTWTRCEHSTRMPGAPTSGERRDRA
jgi:hypothetical protein